jgi:hypothetical protein
MPAQDTHLQEMQDRHLIEEVLRRYCRGVDRGDAALIRSVYFDDATDDHGSFKGSGVDFADRVVAVLNQRARSTMHNLHQVNIRFEGVTAWVETYFTAHHRICEGTTTVLESFGGRYVDRFEKRTEWRIANRVVVHDWSRIENVAREYPHESFEQGQRSHDDLSYQNI